ncbi:MAG: hypothetical protein Q9201_002788 [Fulgogasparrea decipioides]
MDTTETDFSPQTPEDSIYYQLESYPFASDPEFLSGLSTILSSTPSQDPSLLTLRARCFYFSHKQNIPVDFEAYKAWRSEQSLPPVTADPLPVPDPSPSSDPQPNGISSRTEAKPPGNPAQPAAPYPSSFSQIVDLITKGEPILGIKEVPATLLTGQESAATTAKRKKPWEKDEEDASIAETTMGATDEVTT